jgi:non-specific serine/threonine protein kinase
MAEDAAANAVLGADLDSLRTAVARHWGLGDDVLQMIRRLPAAKAVRTPDDDGGILRATASAANELADAIQLKPPQRAAAAVDLVAKRYAKVLKITSRDVREALHGARIALRDGGSIAASTAPERASEATPHTDAAAPAQALDA